MSPSQTTNKPPLPNNSTCFHFQTSTRTRSRAPLDQIYDVRNETTATHIGCIGYHPTRRLWAFKGSDPHPYLSVEELRTVAAFADLLPATNAPATASCAVADNRPCIGHNVSSRPTNHVCTTTAPLTPPQPKEFPHR